MRVPGRPVEKGSAEKDARFADQNVAERKKEAGSDQKPRRGARMKGRE